MRKIYALVLIAIICLTVAGNADTWTATPTQPIQNSNVTAPIYTVNASTTARTSIDTYLNGRREVIMEVSGKVWLNGTTATPSSGIAVYSGANPHVFRSDLPYRNPGISVIASSTGTTLKLMPIR